MLLSGVASPVFRGRTPGADQIADDKTDDQRNRSVCDPPARITAGDCVRLNLRGRHRGTRWCGRLLSKHRAGRSEQRKPNETLGGLGHVVAFHENEVLN
jgi:hypothetical protein